MNHSAASSPLDSAHFNHADSLRVQVTMLYLWLLIAACIAFMASYIATGQYQLILWLAPYLLPSLLFLYFLRRTGSYGVSLGFMLYFCTLLGLMKLLSEPDYLVDLFLLPCYIGSAFLILRVRDALWTVGYLLLLMGGSTAIVAWWQPFDLVYANTNRASIATGFIVGLCATITMFYYFARNYQRNSQLLGEALLTLRKVNDDNKLLISVFSHDFRNYLLRVLLQVEQSKRVCSGADQQQCLENIENAMHELSDLITEAQKVRSLFGDAFSTTSADVSSDEVLRKLALIFRHQLLAKRLELDCPEQPALVLHANPDILIHMILANLLGNAIKFSPEGGTINIRATREGAVSHLSIVNVAAAEHSSNLQRAAAGSAVQSLHGTHDEQGQGLGLAIARRFCELQGIALEIRTTAAAHGMVQVNSRLSFS